MQPKNLKQFFLKKRSLHKDVILGSYIIDFELE
jgi:hypothetical protein